MITYSIHQISKYFLYRSDDESGDLLSNLKLQKLCYYAAGVINAVRRPEDPPLFVESIEAWKHGPVVPELYHHLKRFGGGSIPAEDNYDLTVLNEADKTILDDIYNFYGQFAAWKLRDMTHEESPWQSAYGQTDNSITRSSLRHHFTEEVSDSYIRSYRDAVLS